MRADLTDITLVVDRSGSMNGIREDAEGGVNAFIENQAREAGQALLTLVEFDTAYDFVHRGVPMEEVPDYHLVPRGATALLDAVGRAIHETGERLRRMREAERPGLVIFVVVTDGLENSSCEFTREGIKSMIQHQQEKYSWQFTFLGADQDAFGEARGIGISPDAAAGFDKQKVRTAYRATGDKIGRMRRQRSLGEAVINEFTSEERQEMS